MTSLQVTKLHVDSAIGEWVQIGSQSSVYKFYVGFHMTDSTANINSLEQEMTKEMQKDILHNGTKSMSETIKQQTITMAEQTYTMTEMTEVTKVCRTPPGEDPNEVGYFSY